MSQYSFLKSKFLIKYKIEKFFGKNSFTYYSSPDEYSRGKPAFSTLDQKALDNADVVITYPHVITDQEKLYLLQLANDLGKKKKVFVYEVSLELGGGSEEIIEAAKFVYQHFQPILELTGNLLIGVSGNLIYDIIKKVYSDKKNPILNSQFTIQRKYEGIAYHYVFDNLDADTAIEASKQIPAENKSSSKHSYENVYLRYVTTKKKWISIQV